MRAAAAGIVQNLIDLFVEQNLSGDRRETGQTLQFLDEELRRREVALQQAEQQRVEFEQRFLGVLPGAGSISSSACRRPRPSSPISSSRSRPPDGSLSAMRGQLAATPPTIAGVGGENSGTATGQIAALEGQLNRDLAQGWTESHPDVVALRQQIARLRPVRGAPRRASGNTAACPIPATSRCAR